jgi:hypothetical protein
MDLLVAGRAQQGATDAIGESDRRAETGAVYKQRCPVIAYGTANHSGRPPPECRGCDRVPPHPAGRPRTGADRLPTGHPRSKLNGQVIRYGQASLWGAVLGCIPPSRSTCTSTTFALLNHRVVLRLGTRLAASQGAPTCSPGRGDRQIWVPNQAGSGRSVAWSPPPGQAGGREPVPASRGGVRCPVNNRACGVRRDAVAARVPARTWRQTSCRRLGQEL